jgi:hypothetical protein
VRFMLLFSNFGHRGGGGAAIDSAPSQEDPYLSPCEDFKSITFLVQELLCSKVGVVNCDAVNSSSSSSMHNIGYLRF